MQLFHAFFNGFGHTFNAFNNSVFGHVGVVYAHAAVGFVIRIERIADNGSNFHFNAFMEYFFSAYAFRNGTGRLQDESIQRLRGILLPWFSG